MMRRGFTVVELVITIAIMGILLTLAVVNLNSTQANARDNERKSDVENIALQIENYYTNNDSSVFMSGGTYLGTSYIYDSVDGIRTFLPDIETSSLYSPSSDQTGTISLVEATNTTTNPSSILPTPSANNDIYVYQSLASDGGICIDPFITAGGCRKFNIFYYQETTNTVEVITSKRQ